MCIVQPHLVIILSFMRGMLRDAAPAPQGNAGVCVCTECREIVLDLSGMRDSRCKDPGTWSFVCSSVIYIDDVDPALCGIQMNAEGRLF